MPDDVLLHTQLSHLPCRFAAERERRGALRSNYDRARKQCAFGSAIYDELAAVFERNPRPDLATRKALAEKVGASLKQMNRW